MSSGPHPGRMGVSSPFDLTGGSLPAWAERRFVVIEPGCSLPYDLAQWRGSLVVVASARSS